MPPLDPPFDDELSPEVWASAHQLALDWPAPAGASRIDAGGANAGRTNADGTRADTPGAVTGQGVAGASVEAKLAVRRFVAACVEVINGHRPAAHLRRLSRPGEAAGVITQAVAATRRAAEIRRTAVTGAASRPSRHGRGQAPVAILQLRLCEPLPGVVEAAVVLVTGERTWAVAVRLEHHQQSWLATTLRLV